MGGYIFRNVDITFEEVYVLVLFREGLKCRRDGMTWSTPSHMLVSGLLHITCDECEPSCVEVNDLVPRMSQRQYVTYNPHAPRPSCSKQRGSC